MGGTGVYPVYRDCIGCFPLLPYLIYVTHYEKTCQKLACIAIGTTGTLVLRSIQRPKNTVCARFHSGAMGVYSADVRESQALVYQSYPIPILLSQSSPITSVSSTSIILTSSAPLQLYVTSHDACPTSSDIQCRMQC